MVKEVKKNKATVCNLQRAVKISQSIVWDFETRVLQHNNIETILQDANNSSAIKTGKLEIFFKSTEISHKSSETKFYGLMTFTKVMERPKNWEKMNLLMIINIQAHL